jgi:hypothetical protein
MFRTGTVVLGGRIWVVVLIGLLIIGIIGYAGVSVLYSASRVNAAERTLASVVSHQNTMNTTFGELNTQLSALNSSANFDSEQALTLVDRSMASSRVAVKTVDGDDASLRRSQDDLDALPWLSTLGRQNVDHEAARIAHARNALASARVIASDELLDGQFWHALYLGLADFTTLNAQSLAGDIAGARTTLTKMKGEIDQAAALASAPGLPADLRALMADLQKFVVDYSKHLDARAAGDDAADTAAAASIDADVNKIATYNIDTIGGEIDAFYRPMIDRYNSEMAAATA